MLKVVTIMLTLILFGVFFFGNFVLAQDSWTAGAGTEFGALSAGAGIQTTTTLPDLIGKIISVVLGLLGIVMLVIIIYAGWMWMTAGGETKDVDKAKAYIKNAIAGLVLILLAYAITDFIIDKITVIQMTK